MIEKLSSIYDKSEKLLEKEMIYFANYMETFDRDSFSMAEYKTMLIISKPFKDHCLIESTRNSIVKRYNKLKNS